ncbi:helix-turn-helix transcriptional regulator [Alicycliphilus denitrificans]|uniref:helix-turn-helix transcriptional regulator n=1 Tax=Alicycliphilus denitrificans TaxID=179636 RepID=UPI00384DC10F
MAQQALTQYTQALAHAFSQRRKAVHARLDAIEATLAGFGEASFLATRRGLVWRLSPLAAEWLRGAHMLCPRDGTLTHANPVVARRLRLALEQVAHTGRGATLAVPAGWGEALRLDIGPAHASLRLGSENTLFARLRRNSAFAQPDVEELCAHFGLPPAEGRVLAALVSGHAPNEYASVAGLAQHTVRNQIAALMRKMGCSRQSELVRLGALLR